jgi:hypothetical protein
MVVWVTDVGWDKIKIQLEEGFRYYPVLNGTPVI